MSFAVAYIATVVAINMAFAWNPALAPVWALFVGGVFVLRDYTQRSIGHWVVLPMVGGIVLSYFMANPFVAFASGAAFAVSESTDWLIYTITKRSLKDRILYSCACSAPLDSAVFLGLIGVFAPLPFAISVASKMAAALLVWLAYWGRERAIV